MVLRIKIHLAVIFLIVVVVPKLCCIALVLYVGSVFCISAVVLYCPRSDFAQKEKSRGGTLVTCAYIMESTYS